MKPQPEQRISDDALRDRLRDYATEFAQLCQTSAPKHVLLNGDGKKHGLNHLNEVIQMIAETNKAEFRVRE